MSLMLMWESSGKINYDETIEKMHNTLSETLKNTLFNIDTWIDAGHIPKRGHDLMEDVRLNSQESVVQAGVLTIKLGSDLPYAEYVERMTTSQVRHYDTDFEHSGKKAYSHGWPVHLNDPRAEGHFMRKLLEFTKERLYINLDKAKGLYMSGRKYSKERFELHD